MYFLPQTKTIHTKEMAFVVLKNIPSLALFHDMPKKEKLGTHEAIFFFKRTKRRSCVISVFFFWEKKIVECPSGGRGT